MSLHHGRRHQAMHWATFSWLTLVWVLLWGELSLANVLAVVVLAALVTTVLPLPPIDFHGRVRPLGVLRLVGRFGVDLVRASYEVSLIALRPRYTPRGAVIGVRLRSHSDLYLTMTAELSSLVPGSLVIEAHRLTGMLYLHVLDIDRSGGVERNRRAVLDLEERVMRAMASDAELERAGLPARRPSRRAGGGSRPPDGQDVDESAVPS